MIGTQFCFIQSVYFSNF